ncbi:MAG: transketolase family protein [bacterium]|nr:transketolase family protein [bacterium]
MSQTLCTRTLGTRDVYGDVLVRLGQQNPNIVVLDADLSCSTRTEKFAKAFPDRFFNLGIAEQDMISTAAGLAAFGKIPFVSTFAVFATGRAWDQIRQSICYSMQNVKIVATHAGITVGEDSATHQANEDIALMRSLPNMNIIVPADGIETEKALEYLVHDKNPVYVRLSRCKFPVILDSDYVFQKGKAVLLEEGSEATIIAIGIMVSRALRACEMLKKEGLSTRLLNMSTVKPIDQQAIVAAAEETGCIVTAEEHSVIGGLGSAVAEIISERCPVPLKRIGLNDCFGISGDAEKLLTYYGLTAEAIAQAVKDVVARKRKRN